MAKEKQKNQTALPDTSPNAQGSGKLKDKKGDILFGLIAFLTAIVIMVAVLGGASFFVISKNINGIADKYRSNIQGIPVLSWALPKLPDPEDPKYLTSEQLKTKYNELRAIRTDLQKKLDEANKTIAELQKYKDNEAKLIAENEKIKTEAEAVKAKAEADTKKLEEEKKKFNELIATQDKAGFKEYFENVDKETAEKIYTQIMQEQKATEDAKKLSQLYEKMEPAAAAAIFEQMGTSKLDNTIEILKNMKRDAVTEILAAMTPDFAGKVTDKLSKLYLNTTAQKTQ